jgi:hypothetical protein
VSSTPTDVCDLTRAVEEWLAGVIDLVQGGLQEKHRALAAGELEFLRDTY